MKGEAVFERTVYGVVLLVLFAFLANCGSDSAAPADPATTSEIPDIVFFNTIDPSAVVLFEGRATDNTRVKLVEISFDNGTNWHAADIDNTAPNTLWNVAWSYLADFGDIPAAMNTVLIRAEDGDGNEVISSPIPLEKHSGNSVGDLETLFSSATEGQVIALSSGVEGAYGTTAAGPSIPVEIGLTVLGSGYGSTTTSGGLTFPSVASTATIIQSAITAASIFSVDADLDLENLRLVGGLSAIHVSDTGGTDPQVSVVDCVFDGQIEWALKAQDNDAGINIEFVSSIVDASSATSTSRGGLFFNNVNHNVKGSEFYYHTDPGGPSDSTYQGAAIQVLDGAGEITGSFFSDNGMAIWVSGAASVITSNLILSEADSTYGINLTGGTGSALIRRNTIDGNTGYGLRVGGLMELMLRKNSITGNGMSGVLIDSELDNPSLVKIDMGKLNDHGDNLLDNNDHPNGIGAFETQVYVTQGTSEGSTWIPANWNYWGYVDPTEVDFAGVDNGENGGGRATLAIGSFHPTIIPEVGP